MQEKREAWVDYIKNLACLLVALGHFFQSMIKASIIHECDFRLWFDKTIYYFHVPLFFICSGYLYQKYSRVNSWKTWRNNVQKKAIYLGVPYFAFSTLTWVIKATFADVTSNAIGGIVEVLFINPYPPYWYLYVLFFIFLVLPTMETNKEMGILLAVAVAMKLSTHVIPELPIWGVYAIYGLFSYTIWFVLGMGIAVIGVEKIKKRQMGIVLFVLFIGLSVIARNVSNSYIETGMTALACVAVFMVMTCMSQKALLDIFSPYTMPVFLMHTLIAAPVRILLLKTGISNVVIHVTLGLIASILGPIIVIKVMEKIKLDILVYPGKYIKNTA